MKNVLIRFLFPLASLLLAAACKPEPLYIPEKATCVVFVEPQKLTEAVFVKYLLEINSETTGVNPVSNYNSFLEKFDLFQKEISKIQIFTLGLISPNGENSVGMLFHIPNLNKKKIKHLLKQPFVSKLKSFRYKNEVVFAKEPVYNLFLHIRTGFLIISSNKSTMEKIIDVIHGAPGIVKNKDLYFNKTIQADSSIYGSFIISKKLISENFEILAPLFDGAGVLKFNISFTDGISFSSNIRYSTISAANSSSALINLILASKSQYACVPIKNILEHVYVIPENKNLKISLSLSGEEAKKSIDATSIYLPAILNSLKLNSYED